MAIMNVFRERWANLLWGAFGILLILVAFWGGGNNQLAGNILYGAALVVGLLAVIRSVYVGVVITNAKGSQNKGESVKRENIVLAGIAWVLLSSLLLLIGCVMLAMESTSTGVKVVWGGLAAIFLCQLIGVAYGVLKPKKG